MIDLVSLISLMNKKGFYYIDGKTNTQSDNLYLCFSTGHNGRGNAVDMKLGPLDNDIEFFLNGDKPKKFNKISNALLIELINRHC